MLQWTLGPALRSSLTPWEVASRCLGLVCFWFCFCFGFSVFGFGFGLFCCCFCFCLFCFVLFCFVLFWFCFVLVWFGLFCFGFVLFCFCFWRCLSVFCALQCQQPRDARSQPVIVIGPALSLRTPRSVETGITSTLSSSTSPDSLPGSLLYAHTAIRMNSDRWVDDYHYHYYGFGCGLLIVSCALLCQHQRFTLPINTPLGDHDRPCPAFGPHHTVWRVAGGMGKTRTTSTLSCSTPPDSFLGFTPLRAYNNSLEVW